MSGSLNMVQLIGNLGADPEVRSFQNGGAVANLRIATSENWKDKNTGERQERTEWHTVAIFSEGLIKVVEQYLRKGSKVYIEGQLQTRKWQDQSGADRYSTEVVIRGFGGTLIMLDGAQSGQGGGRDGDDNDRGRGSGGGSNRGSGGSGGNRGTRSGGGGGDWGSNNRGGGGQRGSGDQTGGGQWDRDGDTNDWGSGGGGGGSQGDGGFGDDLDDDIPF